MFRGLGGLGLSGLGFMGFMGLKGIDYKVFGVDRVCRILRVRVYWDGLGFKCLGFKVSWCSVGFKHCGQWHSEGFSMVNSRALGQGFFKRPWGKGFRAEPPCVSV